MKHLARTLLLLITHAAAGMALCAAVYAASGDGTNAVAAAAAPSKTIIDYYFAGGVLMHPMTLSLFAVIWLIIYHVLALREGRMMPAADVQALRALMYQRDAAGAYAFCAQRKGLLARAFGAGVTRLKPDSDDHGRAAAEASIAEEIDRQETRMSFWLNLISVIAALSPMLGLLGTVQGMVGAFDKIGAGGMGKPEVLAGDIGVALLTTFYGLTIGIPAMLSFFIFRGRLNALLAMMSDTITRLLDLYTGEGVARQQYEQTFAQPGYAAQPVYASPPFAPQPLQAAVVQTQTPVPQMHS